MLHQNQKWILELCWDNGLLNTMDRHRLIVKLTGLTKKQIYDWARCRKKKIMKKGGLLPQELQINNDVEDFTDTTAANLDKMHSVAFERGLNHFQYCAFAALCSISDYRIFNYLVPLKPPATSNSAKAESFSFKQKRPRDDDEEWVEVPKKRRNNVLMNVDDNIFLPPPPSPNSEKKFVDFCLLNAFQDGVLDRDENFELVSTLVDCSVEYIQEFVTKRGFAG